MPELKKVILADIVDQALAILAGGVEPVPLPVSASMAAGSLAPEELERIQEAVNGLGEAPSNLEEAMGNLRESLGGNSR